MAARDIDAAPDGAPATEGSCRVSDGGAECTATVVITNRRGLHARAAAKFVKLAVRYGCNIEVRRQDTAVSGCSIMGLMMLAAGPGCLLEIRTTGPEADDALAALVDLVRRGFDED